MFKIGSFGQLPVRALLPVPPAIRPIHGVLSVPPTALHLTATIGLSLPDVSLNSKMVRVDDTQQTTWRGGYFADLRIMTARSHTADAAKARPPELSGKAK